MYALVNIWWGLNCWKLWESFSCYVMILHPFHCTGSNHLGRVQLFMLSVSEERLPLCKCLYASVCHLMKHALRSSAILLKAPTSNKTSQQQNMTYASFLVFLIACSSEVKQRDQNFTGLALFLAGISRERIYSKHHTEPWLHMLAFALNPWHFG